MYIFQMIASKKTQLLQLAIAVHLMWAIQCQNYTRLEVNKIRTVTLPAGQHEQFVISISKQPAPSEFLFVTAESPFNDPFEEPYMTITSTQGFSLRCDDQSSSYTGICRINPTEIKAGRQFLLEVYCLSDCTLKIAAYIDEIYKLQLGKAIELSSMADFGLAELIKIEIPSNISFTSVLILAKLVNYENANEGVTVLANYGTNTTEPSESNYMMKAQPTYGHRLSIQITSSSISPGDQIILYCFMGINNTIELSTYVIEDSIISLTLASPLVDFTSDGETKIYIADLQEYQGLDLQTKDIMVKIIVYSGSPEVKLSFDENFTDINTQDNWFIESSFVYLLTPTFRREKNFTNKIYVSVSSYFLSSYYIELIVNTKNYLALENGIMQLVKIVPDGLQNFIFEDDNYADETESNGEVRYKVTVQIIEGSVQIGIRDCDSLMRTADANLEGCLIRNVSQIRDPEVKKSFDNVQGEMKKYYNTYQIIFYYNVTTCPKVSLNSHLERYVCDYHIIVHNLVRSNNPSQVYLGIELTKYSEPKQLKEGVILKDSVPEQEYNYYSLEIQSVENISKVEIYTTVIQGDIAMLIARKNKFPDFETLSDDDVEMNIFGHYVVEGNKLTKGIYYFAIYGYEVSDYTISVAIQRSKGVQNHTDEGKAEVTEIRLQKGLSQSFTMPLNKQMMKFSIMAPKAEASIIKITTIAGTISYSIREKASSNLICDSYSLSVLANPQCQFTSKPNATYLIQVNGSESEVETFVISYSDEQTCNTYPIDIPMYLSLDLAGDGETNNCFIFTLLQLSDMEITVAMSELDKIQSRGYVSVNLKFKGAPQAIPMKDYEQIFTKSQLEILCAPSNAQEESLSSGSTSSRCQFHLEVIVNSTLYKSENPSKASSVQLMIAVQAFDDENVLFDGIPEKIVTQRISQSVGKHFYYFVYDLNNTRDLNIYLTTQTNSNYQMLARVVSDTIYARDYEGVEYPSFNSNLSDVEVANSTQFSPITALTIKKQRLRVAAARSTTNVVLISVYGLSSIQNETYIFKVEATSTSTFLAYGESKLGYVGKDEIYEYEANIDGATPSVLSVRPMGAEKCLRSYVLTQRFLKQSSGDDGKLVETTVQFDRIHPFSSESGTRRILIKGISSNLCTYQISHYSLGSPLKTVFMGVPYEIKIDRMEGSSYYLYYSVRNESLHIIQMINGGNSNIYAMPIGETSTDSIEELLQKNLDNFVWKGDLNANLHIDREDSNFCLSCYYLIAVKGRSIVDAELIVNIESLPIPLKEGSILKDKLTQNHANSYLFYSTSSFNITVTPIYGHLNIEVSLPAGQTQSNMTFSDITSTRDIPILVQQLSTNSLDYFDANARFIVTITASKQSYYYIGVKKILIGARLFQGMPISLDIKDEATITFVNYQKDLPLNILVEDLKYNQGSTRLEFQVTKINHQGATDTGSITNLIQRKLESEGTYNLEIYSQVADYTLKVRSARPTSISVILAKSSLTHLVATRTVMVTNPAIFQIFSPGDSIMIEVFSCSGEIEVSASSNYSRISDGSFENVVRMEHANYGGHYVISAEDLKGEYFVQTKSLAPTGSKEVDVSYLISYYLYSPQEQQKMPYKVYGIMNSYIEYSYKPGKIEYRMSKIYRKDNGSTPGTSVYTLYISNSSESITKMTKCSLGKVSSIVVSESNTLVNSKSNWEFVTFSLNETELKNIVGESSFYYVGGQASFTWGTQRPHHVKSVSFVYDISQMVAGNQPEFRNVTKTENTFFVLLWIVVPFAIGSFVFYLAVKYFINSVRQGPNQLIEEEVGESQEVFGSQSQPPDGYKVGDNRQVDHNPDKYSIE